MDHVTPSLIKVAVDKGMSHRLRLIGPEPGKGAGKGDKGWQYERSLQWGGSEEAARQYVRDLWREGGRRGAVEKVLAEVVEGCPVPV